MKPLLLLISMISAFPLMARELIPFDDAYVKNLHEENKLSNDKEELKVAFLTNLIKKQQKEYEDKINFLEMELRKTKDRLVEKSLNQEKLEEALKDKYAHDTSNLKKELASTTKSLFEYQRQIEKIKPSEDLKNMIKLNTELASELRRSEDQIAFIQLKRIEEMPGIHSPGTGSRMPASVKNKK